MTDYHYYTGTGKVEVEVDFEALIPVGATKDQAERLFAAAVRNTAASNGFDVDSARVVLTGFSRGQTVDTSLKDDSSDTEADLICASCTDPRFHVKHHDAELHNYHKFVPGPLSELTE